MFHELILRVYSRLQSINILMIVHAPRKLILNYSKYCVEIKHLILQFVFLFLYSMNYYIVLNTQRYLKSQDLKLFF